MLQTFRKHSGGIFAKILFGLLVASFAFWGIGDMLHSYTAMQPVAKVGGISISQEEFLGSYQKIVTRLQTIAKGKLKPEDIHQLGVEKRVLDDLVDNAVLENEIRSLGLVVSNTALQEFIRSVPAFKNKYGEFDRNQFRYLLSHNELSEAGFIQQSREGLLRQQLIGTLSSGLRLPAQYQDLIFNSQEQQKVFNVVYIPLSIAQAKETPTDTDIEQLYQTSQELFVQPEYREVSVLIIDPKKIQDAIVITPAQLQEEYLSNQSAFMTPEQRDVTQLTFSSKENAIKAQEGLVKGKPLATVAKDFKGEVRTYPQASKDKFSDEHSKEIFAQQLNGVTGVLSSAFGWTIFQVTGISEPKALTLDSVKDKLEADLKSQLYNSKINELQNKVEDGLAGGTPLKEIAQQYNLEVMEIGLIDATGQNKKGESVIPTGLREVVLENAFEVDEGLTSSLINMADGRSAAVAVTKVIPKNLPSLSDIREEVAKVWRQNKQREAAYDIAQAIVAKVKSAQDLAEQAKQHNLIVRTLQPISRVELEEGKLLDEKVTPQALRSGFALSMGHAAATPIKDGFIIVMPIKALPLDHDKNKDKRANFQKAFQAMIQRDFQTAYITALKEKNKPDIRQDTINNLLAR
ncbi:peptidylprolyl isomerase [Candidatus Odyssella thessalonicensis]|uniref:peptidylprolyl isomerase n=1 Tax=Candidatus Odyssella thessalonicensis TaxID=84647 RepID=UPI000225B6F9|nr:peptidylprolyl isomerase [Candidatus Odyssella thessalonicensis]